MPEFQRIQVSAFTRQPLGGNPSAVVLDAARLSPADMLAIAREMNLSETAFVLHGILVLDAPS
jgi:trans-2,3-dihydro-3-hydroxyanthranilate isomerase